MAGMVTQINQRMIELGRLRSSLTVEEKYCKAILSDIRNLNSERL